jgi:hypothetical protein
MPAIGSDSETTLNWCLEAVQEGQAWLDSQRPTQEWSKVLEMMGPQTAGAALEGLSQTGYNLVERNARDIVASLSNFRHDGEFKPRFDKELYNEAHVLTKLDANWYVETNAYERHRANMQNTVVLGTGYLYETWDKDFWGDHGDISLESIDPKDVSFIQLPGNGDLQKAYAVIIREEMPLNLARATFWAQADKLQPDRDNPSWLIKGLRKVQRLIGGSPALATAGTGGRRNTGSFPTVDIFRMYVMDRSINTSGMPRTMGTKGTNWSYTVPSIGGEVPTGVTNPATGQPFTRPADDIDARLFPLRRHVIFSRTCTIYDGSSPWWHGQVPLARTRFNDWPWEALGKSLLADPRTMQEGIIALMRYIEDACAARLDPPMLFNEQSVSEGFAAKFNPRRAGVRASANLDTGGKQIEFPVSIDHYRVEPFITNHIKDQENRINHQMGTPDLVAVAKAKQIPSSDSLEKMMEMAGPLVQDMVRSLEQPLQQLGEWRKAYYFQFYNRARVLTLTGPDEQPEDFQYEPELLVRKIDDESAQARQDRTKRYVGQFKYRVTESGKNEMHRMANKLALLQLRKAGLPIDWWTIGKAWKLPNLGPEPTGTNNMLERFIAEKRIEAELAEELAPQGPGPGRPASGKKPPQIKQKDGGTRSTVTQS